MAKLSVVIISYNEEHNIRRCLESVNSIADEIVIVDSFSTDNTVAIATSMGALVYQNAFEGHIQQKNYALSKASYELVLSLDSDEALDPFLQKQIQSIKNNFEKDGYYLKRLTNYCGHWVRHCGWYPDKKLRLFKKNKGMWSGVNPHDKFQLFTGDSNTQTLSGDILHYSYYTVDQHIRQTRYFADISAREMFRLKRKPRGVQLIINPLIYFIKSYFIKLGFLDGWRGIQICCISTYAVFLKYKIFFRLVKEAKG